jgi:hypothetical protein
MTQTSSVSPRTPLHANHQPAVRAFPATEPEWFMSYGLSAPSQATVPGRSSVEEFQDIQTVANCSAKSAADLVLSQFE